MEQPFGAQGIGKAAPAILSTGASRYSKLSSITNVLLKKPIRSDISAYEVGREKKRESANHVEETLLLVFLAEALMVALSSGLIERRFLTCNMIS